jgi:putative DNA primase/helicase
MLEGTMPPSSYPASEEPAGLLDHDAASSQTAGDLVLARPAAAAVPGPLLMADWNDEPAVLRRLLSRLKDVRRTTYRGEPAWRAIDPVEPAWFLYVQLSEWDGPMPLLNFPHFDQRRQELEALLARGIRNPVRVDRLERDEKSLHRDEKKHTDRVLAAIGLTTLDDDESPLVGAVPLSALAARETRWLCPRWLAESAVSMLEGVAGADTRALLLSLAGIVSGGQAFPDGAPSGHARDVLLLTPDPDLADVRRCLVAAGGQLERIQVLREECFGSGPRPRRQGSPGVEDLLRLCGNVSYRLIIITPLESYWPGDRPAEAFADQLAWLARESGAAVVLGRQANGKGKATRALHRVTSSVLLCAPDPADRGDLILAMRHGTLAAHPPALVARAGQAGGLPRLRWQGETHWTPEELLAGPGRKALREDRALGRALKFLAEVLARGALEMHRLEQLGADAGHSLGTLRRAKQVLGVLSVQDQSAPGRPWKWALPAPDDVPTEQVRTCAPALRTCSQDGSNGIVEGCAGAEQQVRRCATECAAACTAAQGSQVRSAGT